MFNKITLPCLLAISVLFISSCSSTQKLANPDSFVELDEIVVSGLELPYQAAAQLEIDLIHTKLDVRFDWSKSHLIGVADISFRPYFYSTDSIVLDAKGFDINSIKLLKDTGLVAVNYTYDSLQLNIKLGKFYSREDTLTLRIDYIAKPDELDVVGSSAIAADKGLYFINPLGKIPNKPKQIWTQGETEANSCWFPTIDKPNQRTTEEIYITVDSIYTTLSNGLMLSSTNNGDGTRTDHWKQEKSHTPYLFMMAIGEFTIVKDEWNGMEVNYYVENEYKRYAKQIFGNTPEMMSFYSDLLGYEYPWEKYNQIAVRDYVSGAMENTSASLFGEFVQRNDAELEYRNNESIVAHELFHQWFGDLVTCESWSNLPLNEAFATYGEYLWFEHKYGRNEAQLNLYKDKAAYLREAKAYQKNLIRFYYGHREEMFDRHSYQKGGLILHALRNYLGDDAFFAGLKEYLHSNEFQAVEAHQLRLAFEKVSGIDLNWFFNQWFYGSGHAELNIRHHFNDSLKLFTITIEQVQDEENESYLHLPLKVAFLQGNAIHYENIVVDNQWKQFVFEMDQMPENYIVDAEHILVGTTNYLNKKTESWIKQYQAAQFYLNKDEALSYLSDSIEQTAVLEVFKAGLADNYYASRISAIKHMPIDSTSENRIALLYKVAAEDSDVRVRVAAIDKLGEVQTKTMLLKLQELLKSEQSNIAKGRILRAIKYINETEAFELAKNYESATEVQLLANVADLYAKQGDESHLPYFEKMIYETRAYSKYYVLYSYGKLLEKMDAAHILKGAAELKLNAIYEGASYIRKTAGLGLYDLWLKAAQEAETAENSDWKTTADSLKVDLEEVLAREKTESVKKAFEKRFIFEL